jgi:hypothetical protein
MTAGQQFAHDQCDHATRDECQHRNHPDRPDHPEDVGNDTSRKRADSYEDRLGRAEVTRLGSGH